MGTLRGTVDDLMISREIGRFLLMSPAGFPAPLILYKDTGVDMIDPTEMVRRNWMIGLLQQSLTRRMEVTVVYGSHVRVQSVTLHTTITKKVLPVQKTMTGIVKQITIIAGKGIVTLYGATISLSSGKRAKPGYHYPSIYADEGVIHAEESNRRKRIIALLRHALADGLEVSVTYGAKPPALISRAVLHAKE